MPFTTFCSLILYISIKGKGANLKRYKLCSCVWHLSGAKYLPIPYSAGFGISSATYFLCFAFQKTGVGLWMAMTYCIYLNLFDTLKLLKFLSVFPENSVADTENMELIKISVIISFLFFFSGFLLSKFHKTFK